MPATLHCTDEGSQYSWTFSTVCNWNMKCTRVQHTCLSVQYTNLMNKGTIDYLVTPLYCMCVTSTVSHVLILKWPISISLGHVCTDSSNTWNIAAFCTNIGQQISADTSNPSDKIKFSTFRTCFPIFHYIIILTILQAIFSSLSLDFGNQYTSSNFGNS